MTTAARRGLQFIADPLADSFAGSGRLSVMLAHNWWIIGLRGVFGVMIGTFALTMPGETVASLIVCFATYMFLDGIFAIEAGLAISAHHRDWVGLILEGMVNLIAGAVVVLWPLATLLVLAWVIGCWAIVSGVVLLIAAFRLHGAYGRGFFILGGVASMAWGMHLMTTPVSNTAVMTWWFGVYALVFGLALLGLTFRLRDRHQRQAS